MKKKKTGHVLGQIKHVGTNYLSKARSNEEDNNNTHETRRRRPSLRQWAVMNLYRLNSQTIISTFFFFFFIFVHAMYTHVM